MIIVEQTAGSLKRYLENSLVSEYARLMVMRMVLAFLLHRGRMSCSSAAGMIASRPHASWPGDSLSGASSLAEGRF